jgi:hypothetical protein
VTALELLKSLLDDWIRYRWRDTVALTLIGIGFFVMMHSTDMMVRIEAKAMIAAALIILDPRAMLPGNSRAPADPPVSNSKGAPGGTLERK